MGEIAELRVLDDRPGPRGLGVAHDAEDSREIRIGEARQKAHLAQRLLAVLALDVRVTEVRYPRDGQPQRIAAAIVAAAD